MKYRKNNSHTIQKRKAFSAVELAVSTLLLSMTIIAYGYAYTQVIVPGIKSFRIDDIRADMQAISALRTSPVEDLEGIPNVTYDESRGIYIYKGAVLNTAVYRGVQT